MQTLLFAEQLRQASAEVPLSCTVDLSKEEPLTPLTFLEIKSKKKLMQANNCMLKHPHLTILGLKNANSEPLLSIEGPKDPSLAAMEQALLDTKTSLDIKKDIILEMQKTLAFDQISIHTTMVIDADLKEIGLLEQYGKNAPKVTTHIAMIKGKPNQYLLNLDGSELVYYDLSAILGSSSFLQEPVVRVQNISKKKMLPKFLQHKLLWTRKGKVALPPLIHKTLRENTVNQKAILEANYISVQENQILLENLKNIEELEDTDDNALKMYKTMLPDQKKMLEQTIMMIKKRSAKEIKGKILQVEWKARKNIIGHHFH